jgi:hypothetical protein
MYDRLPSLFNGASRAAAAGDTAQLIEVVAASQERTVDSASAFVTGAIKTNNYQLTSDSADHRNGQGRQNNPIGEFTDSSGRFALADCSCQPFRSTKEHAVCLPSPVPQRPPW